MFFQQKMKNTMQVERACPNTYATFYQDTWMWKGVGGMWGLEKYFKVDHMMMNNKGSHDNDGQYMTTWKYHGDVY
jgi:hypothetical protein